MEDQFYYSNIQSNSLLHLLRQPDFAASLAYLVDFKNHSDFTVTPYEYSIEISNNEITIVNILSVGFETNEYLTLRNKKNFHIICINPIFLQMWEFEDMHLKYIDKLSWFFSVINRSENDVVKEIKWIKNLDI